MNSETRSPCDTPERRAIVLVSAWIVFVVLNVGIRALDWALRDPVSGVRPMPGGLPDWYQYDHPSEPVYTGGCRGVCHAGTFALWVRLVLAVLQCAIAFAGLVVFRILYVVLSGIDPV